MATFYPVGVPRKHTVERCTPKIAVHHFAEYIKPTLCHFSSFSSFKLFLIFQQNSAQFLFRQSFFNNLLFLIADIEKMAESKQIGKFRERVRAHAQN